MKNTILLVMLASVALASCFDEGKYNEIDSRDARVDPVEAVDSGTRNENDGSLIDLGREDVGFGEDVSTADHDSGADLVATPDVDGDATADADAMPCSPTNGGVEVCDGRDNDCNGVLDDGFGLGLSCMGGVGACATEGVQICDNTGLGVVCDAVPGMGSTELCGDDIDNDCDGDLDEGFDQWMNTCRNGVGACSQTGKWQCSANGLELECDAVPGTPSQSTEDRCDNIDNDCDSDIDEGCDDDNDDYCDDDFTTVGTPSVCRQGGGDCDDQEADVFPGNGVVGCDGKDNDCNGTVDDFRAIAGQVDFSLAGRSYLSQSYPAHVQAVATTDGFCVVSQKTNSGELFFDRLSGGAIPIQSRTSTLSTSPILFHLVDVVANPDGCTALINQLISASSNSMTLSIWDQSQFGASISNHSVSGNVRFRMSALDYAAGAANYGLIYAEQTTGADFVKLTQISRSTQTSTTQIVADLALISTQDTVDAIEITATQPFRKYWIGSWESGGLTTSWTDGLFGPILTGLQVQSQGRVSTDLAQGDFYHAEWDDISNTMYVRKTNSTSGWGSTGLLTTSGTHSGDLAPRSLVFGGPENSVWLIEPYDDSVYLIDDQNGVLSFSEQTHPNLSGDILALRHNGDVIEVLSLDEYSTSTIDLKTTSFTCD
jgi:hypothetical protein